MFRNFFLDKTIESVVFRTVLLMASLLYFSCTVSRKLSRHNLQLNMIAKSFRFGFITATTELKVGRPQFLLYRT